WAETRPESRAARDDIRTRAYQVVALRRGRPRSPGCVMETGGRGSDAPARPAAVATLHHGAWARHRRPARAVGYAACQDRDPPPVHACCSAPPPAIARPACGVKTP